MDPDLCKAIDPDGIFASFRGTKTIHDKLVHSRLPSLENSTDEKEPGDEVQPIGGCKNVKLKDVIFVIISLNRLIQPTVITLIAYLTLTKMLTAKARMLLMT